jgi:hypothetical protein
MRLREPVAGGAGFGDLPGEGEPVDGAAGVREPRRPRSSAGSIAVAIDLPAA